MPGLGAAKACMLAAVLELARRAIEEDLTRDTALDHPRRVKQYCKTTLGHRRIEHCVGLYLDSQLRLIASGELARGTLSQASVYPREVVREALRHHAAAVIISHYVARNIMRIMCPVFLCSRSYRFGHISSTSEHGLAT